MKRAIDSTSVEWWRRLSEVVTAALELPPAERAAFIARSCGADHELRNEVENLVETWSRGDDASGDGLEGQRESDGAASLESRATAESEPPIKETLSAALAGRYEVDREIGQGGLARVFLGRDLKHGRAVAIKVLRPELSTALGPERFLHEIRVTANFQHPHILPLHDSGVASDLLYYVMPYVEGESLRSRLERERQLPVEEVVRIIQTLASALDYAHRRGVIHRDIKPENILLSEGQPVLADFGIALALRGARTRITGTGISVGTLQYMSPEQASGERTLGPSSDIYSLAAMAYEMLAGEPPTTGPDSHAVLVRIVSAIPRPIRPVRPAVPVSVEAAVLKALAKTPADRFRTAEEFAAALSDYSLAHGTQSEGKRGWRKLASRAAPMAAALLLAAAIILLGRRWVGGGSPPAARRQLTFVGNAVKAAITPDGRFLAYAIQAGDSFFVLSRDVAGGKADTLATLDLVNTMEWSLDGSQLLVGAQNRSVVVPRLGGPLRSVHVTDRVCVVRAHWVPDNRHVSRHCASDQRIVLTDLQADDTSSIQLRGAHAWFYDGSWSPDGQLFAVATQSGDPVSFAIQTVSRDGRMEVTVEDSIRLGSPRWTRDGGRLYYVRGGDAIRSVQISRETGRRRGDPVEGHTQIEALSMGLFVGSISLSQDERRIVYARGTRFSNLSFVEAGDDGRPHTEQLTTGTALRWSPVVSPNGESIAFVQDQQGAAELYTMPITGGAAKQITLGARVWPYSRIAWSPDGSSIAFESVRAGHANVWVADVAGGGLRSFPQTRMSTVRGHLAWAPSTLVAYQSADQHNIGLLDPVSGVERFIVDSAKPTQFLFSPQFSPDGNYLAVAEGGVGIRAFDLRKPPSGGEIVGEGGFLQGWSLDGRHIIAANGATLLSVDLRHPGAPRPILTTPFREGECFPAGPRRPRAFVCAAFDFVSDVWLIEIPEGGR